MKRNLNHLRAALGALALALVLLVGVSPAASAAGPLFHYRDYPEFRLEPAVPAVTIEALAAANDYDALLARYGGFGVESFANSEYAGAESYSCFYGTADFDYYQLEAEDAGSTAEAFMFSDEEIFRLQAAEDGSTDFGLDWTAVPDWAEARYNLRDEAMALDADALRGYEIVSVTDNQDGTLTVVLGDATAAADALDPALDPAFDPAPEAWNDAWDGEWQYDYVDPDAVGEDGFLYGYDDDFYPGTDDFYPGDALDYWGDGPDRFYDDPDAWYNVPAEEENPADAWYDNTVSWYDDHPYSSVADTDGEPAVRMILTVDAATLEIRKAEHMLVRDDGSEELLMVQLMTVEPPEAAAYAELVARSAVYRDADGMPADPRTVTVIYDAGTMDELVCSRTVEKGDYLFTSFIGGYLLYADAEGSTPFVGSDGMSDVTIYAFPAETAADLPSEDEAAFPAEAEIDVEAEGETYAVDSKEAFVPAEIEEQMPVIIEESMYESEPDEMPVDEMPVDEMPVDEMPADEMPVDEMPADEMPVDEMPAEEMPAEELTLDEKLQMALDSIPQAMPEESDTALDFLAEYRAVYEANRLEALLMNHSSVEYQLVYDDAADAAGWPDYVYETATMAYAESPASAVYVGDGKYYELAENDGGSELYYVFDFCNGYDPILNTGYEIVPETFEEWFNEAEETPLDCFVEDGELHLMAVSSENASRRFVESYLHRTYDGGTVITEAIADPDTHELSAFVFNLEKDGEISEPLTYLAAYDRPVPRACRNLRAAAERDADRVVTVSLVLNPGTPDEVAQTKVVPAGSNVVYIADEYMEMFEDPACTVPAGQWDKNSDHVYYMLPADLGPGEM